MDKSKDDKKKTSVLEDKEKFGTSHEDEKLAHMGQKPGGAKPAEEKPPKRKQ